MRYGRWVLLYAGISWRRTIEERINGAVCPVCRGRDLDFWECCLGCLKAGHGPAPMVPRRPTKPVPKKANWLRGGMK